MALATLFNIPQGPEDFWNFSFANMDQHRQIVDQAARLRGVNLNLYALDPVPTFDPDTWLRIHQQAHVDFTNLLGIGGVDLTSVDFRDPEQLASWIRLHADEHLQASNILGLR